MRPKSRATGFLMMLAAMQAPASVAETADSTLMEHVVVRGAYFGQKAAAGTKTPTLLLDTPQSISVYEAEQFNDQAMTALTEVLQYSPGVSLGQGEDHRDQITLRGQNTTADFFVDGLRDDVQYFRPLYNLERVEILRGANALLFGRGGGGGVVNRVTKSADVESSFSQLRGGIDSFGASTASIDGNWAISPRQALRLNAMVETIDNHRDYKDGNRWAINPSYTLIPDEKTQLSASWETLRDDRVVDRGIPSLNGTPLEGYDETFFGDPDFNNNTLNADIVRLRGLRRLNEAWSLDTTFQYADYDKAYANLYPVAFNDNDNSVTLDGYGDATQRRNRILQVNLVGDLQAFGLQHTLLAGAEYGKQDTSNSRNDAYFVTSSDDQVTFAFSDPLAIPEYSLTDPVRSTQSRVEFASVFVQDEIEIGDHWIAVVGARIDQFDIDVWDDIAAVDGRPRQLSRADTEISPRAGIIWKPVSALSVYLNYSESFLPRSGDQFLTLTPSSAALEPESFENLEGGFKWALSAGTTLSAAAFEITRSNGTAVDPTNPERSVLTGTETRGLEVEISGLVAPRMMISASYTYLDGEELGRYLNDKLANRALPQLPEHKITLWGDLQLASCWRLGLGLIHQSAQYASLSNAVELPDFTRIDAALYFDVSPSLSLQVNMENLLDEGYFPAAHNDNNISVGAPRNARVSFTYTL